MNTMKINIQSPSFHANDKLIDFANDKVSKLLQYSDRILEANVILKINKSDNRSNKSCDVRLAIPGNDLFASRQCPSFEEAILESVDALKQQLISWKEKSQDKTTNLDLVSRKLSEN